ncbi:MAG: Holliday junction branch migration DNA helicase RuvB [Deltaproteobacteria bacterium]|nr:MAG: Holliday junction branch migration DNA helicase RuvB [Deltaproteobacteria bacterium]
MVSRNGKNEPDRLVSPRSSTEDGSLERALRPTTFEEYVGQTETTANLKVFVQAARQRGEALDHVLFCGPPGLGKTTLAQVIANEMGVGFVVSSGPAIERKGDLAGILSNLKERDVLFIDEIHRLPRVVEENLYPSMEDFHFDYVVGDGPSARNLRLRLPQFTLIGATTRTALLSSPLRDRFGVVCRLDFYPPEDLAKILARSASILEVELLPDGAMEIARRSRGTPRIANRLLRRVRDFAQVLGDGRITIDVAKEALAKLGVDELGLDAMDHKILRAIIEHFDGGPVGVEAIAATVAEERETIEDVYEPFLLQVGLLQRTPRGRVATEKAYRHLGFSKYSPQKGLF